MNFWCVEEGIMCNGLLLLFILIFIASCDQSMKQLCYNPAAAV